MGFKSDKNRILADLSDLNFDSQAREAEKNHLASGFLSAEEAAEIVKSTSGLNHRNEPHAQARSIQVWIMEPEVNGVRWYIKGYFTGDQTWFISFHPSEY